MSFYNGPLLARPIILGISKPVDDLDAVFLCRDNVNYTCYGVFFFHFYTRDDQVEEISWGEVEQLGTLVR